MKFYKKIFIIFILLFFYYLLFFNVSAHEESLDNLDFDIYILENGDVKIYETWYARMYDTNTLFKTFPMDEKFDYINDVKIYETDSSNSNAIMKEFTKSNDYQYYVDDGYYQATINPQNYFEIAWGVNANGRKNSIYRIEYTVKNCIDVYKDTAEFYWQLIGDEWAMETDKISGYLHLPNDVQNTDDFKVWAHGPLNGTINKIDNKTCTFEVFNMPTKTFLELRITFPTSLVPYSTRIYDQDYLSIILAEEQENANKANKLRIVAQKKQKLYSNITYIIEIIITFVIFKKLYLAIKSLTDVKYVKPTNKLDYFRDIPNKDASPVTAHVLVKSNDSFKIKSMQNCISALIISLTQKGFISVKPGTNKNDTKITFTEISDDYKENYTNDEYKVYLYLGKIGKEFTLKEFNKYINSHQESFYNLLKAIETENTLVFNSSKYTNFENKKAKSNFLNLSTGFFILSFSVLIISLIIKLCGINLNFKIIFTIWGLLLSGLIYSYIQYKKIPIYSQEGIDEKEQWIGLEKFMKDFSLLNEREVPELALWEKYLVYATAFGIADKVLEQLKTRFPKLNDDDYLRSNYTCLYMASHPSIYHNSFSKSVSSAQSYHSAQVAASVMSSGSGSGGGFSSGGGGRWPEVAAVAVANLSIFCIFVFLFVF